MNVERKPKLIKQPNSLTEARYEMTALEKDLVYITLSRLNGSEKGTVVYRISVKELSVGVGNQINHVHFKKVSGKLLSRVLSVPVGDGKFAELNIVSSAEYSKGKGFIELEFSADMRALLLDLKSKFTMFRLDEALSLKSKYAKRVYEMLSQYKDTGSFHISIREFKIRLGLIDLRTGKEKYGKYTWLRKYVLDVAQRELETTGLSFTYTATKTGAKYTHLHFKMDHKGKRYLEPKQTEQNPKVAGLMDKLVNQYKLSLWQATEVVKSVDTKEIGKTLYDINIKQINNQIQNIGAYTVKTFEQKYKLGLLNT